MDTRTAIITYQYAERIKSELIIASRLFSEMSILRGEALAGGERLMQSYLEALVGEIRIAHNVKQTLNFLSAERKVLEAIGQLSLGNPEAVSRCLSEALSMITTLGQASMELLMERSLL